MIEYIVTMRFKHPAYDEVNGIRYTIRAESKADACKRARRQADHDGHMGRRHFSAVECDRAPI